MRMPLLRLRADPAPSPSCLSGKARKLKEGGNTGRRTIRSCRCHFGPKAMLEALRCVTAAVRSAPGRDRAEAGVIEALSRNATGKAPKCCRAQLLLPPRASEFAVDPSAYTLTADTNPGHPRSAFPACGRALGHQVGFG